MRADPAGRRVEIRVGDDERTRCDSLAVIRSCFQSNLTIDDRNLIQQTVQDGFNTALSHEIGRTLQELTAAVNAILAHLSAEQADEACEDLKRPQEELQKQKYGKVWASRG